ncbi:MAG: helix-turn-helix domain-containing protein [Methanothrix sp.]|nr:helix-turn-helix domain-containing protein [Methanothrix sp.]MDD4447622.1 helix-turn-helix domain-containing protein [Methanothrix sp.]
MKIINLLGSFAVLSLIIVPVYAQPSLKGCACMPGDCPAKPVNNCCSQSSDCRISMGCTCPDQFALYSGIDYYDPGYSHLSRSSSRSPARQGFAGQAASGNAGAFCSVLLSATNSNNNSVGPPDLDVVEYLPPSAKQVFQVLASDGPLTQKDIISKTDLPPRTVRYALDRLRGEEMLEECFCFRDARQSLYRLNGIDTR